jgi:pSer/pThr/pTyr-binding forkhead associated (FHA) protein
MLGWILGILVVVVLVAVVVMALRNQREDPMPHAPPGASIEDEEGTQVRVIGHRLVRLAGGVKVGNEIPIVNTLLIGRDKDCTLSLHDPEMSHHHAEVSIDRDRAYIVDKGSTNGTMVNEQLLEGTEPKPLSDGDRIKVGSTVLVYKAKT